MVAFFIGLEGKSWSTDLDMNVNFCYVANGINWSPLLF